MTDYGSMTLAELRAIADAVAAEVAKREQEAGQRAAVETAVQEYATGQGLTVLQAWRALAPEGVPVPDDPEPVTAPDYKQPTGAHDAYAKGDLVTFQGKVYRARMDAVVWSPLAYPQAWELVTT